MVQNGRLLVQLQVGHSSELLQPPLLADGCTHRWTVFVRSHDGQDFPDRSFVEKVCFQLHETFLNPKRFVSKPPYQVTETGYAGFQIPLQIWLAGKQYKIDYDLGLTMEASAMHTTPATIEVTDYTPEFLEIAKRFGATERVNVKRSRGKSMLAIPVPSTPASPSIPSPSSAHPPPAKKRRSERSADVSARSSPAASNESLATITKKERETVSTSARSSPAAPIEPLKMRIKKEKERDTSAGESARISPATPPIEPLKKEKRDTVSTEDPIEDLRPAESSISAPIERIKLEQRDTVSTDLRPAESSISAPIEEGPVKGFWEEMEGTGGGEGAGGGEGGVEGSKKKKKRTKKKENKHPDAAHHLHQMPPPYGTPMHVVSGVDPQFLQSPFGPLQHHHQQQQQAPPPPHAHNYAAPMPQTPQAGPPPPQPPQPHPGMQQDHHHHPGGPQQMPADPMVDARTLLTRVAPASHAAVEPVFVPTTNPLRTRRVLHSETYLRYIESMTNARAARLASRQQRPVSAYDRSLCANPRNTPTNAQRLPATANWLREVRVGQPVNEDDVARALWRLREELLESTVGIDRDYRGVL